MDSLMTLSVRDFAALSVHAPAWDHLAWGAPQRMPTLLPGWTVAYLRHRLRPRDTWFCSFAYAGDRLVGVLPAIVSPHPVLGRARPVIRTTFDRETTASGDITLATDVASAALDALLFEVRRQVPNHIGIEFRCVRESSLLWNAAAISADGYVAYSASGMGYSRIDLSAGRARYLSARMRRNLKRYRNKLDGRGEVAIQIIQPEPGDQNLLHEFLRLEASGWKGRNGTAIANSAREVAFYSDLVQAFGERGWLEWHTLRVDGRLIAAELGLRCGTALIIPKIAYDEPFADCAPGSILTDAVVRNAFDRGCLTEINHMSHAAWHQFWHMDEDDYHDLNLVREGVLPLLVEAPIIRAKQSIRVAQHKIRRNAPERALVAYRLFKRLLRSHPPTADSRSDA